MDIIKMTGLPSLTASCSFDLSKKCSPRSDLMIDHQESGYCIHLSPSSFQLPCRDGPHISKTNFRAGIDQRSAQIWTVFPVPVPLARTSPSRYFRIFCSFSTSSRCDCQKVKPTGAYNYDPYIEPSKSSFRVPPLSFSGIRVNSLRHSSAVSGILGPREDLVLSGGYQLELGVFFLRACSFIRTAKFFSCLYRISFCNTMQGVLLPTIISLST